MIEYSVIKSPTNTRDGVNVFMAEVNQRLTTDWVLHGATQAYCVNDSQYMIQAFTRVKQ